MVGVLHPDESILLAFVRRQLRDDEWPGIQQHIADCPQCRRRCTEYDQLGAFLQRWATAEYYNTHPALTVRVMQRVNAPASVLERWQERVKLPSLRLVALPVAVVLVMLFSVVLFAVAYRGVAVGHHDTGRQLVSTPTVSVRNNRQTPTAKPRQPTPKATATSANDNDSDNHGQSGNDHDSDNSASGGGNGNLYLCPQAGNQNAFVLQVCGSNFTPGEHIYLIFTIQGYQFQPRELIQVDQNGDFSTSFIVLSCHLQPTAIDAVDAHNQQLAPTLSAIQPGRCSAQS